MVGVTLRRIVATGGVAACLLLLIATGAHAAPGPQASAAAGGDLAATGLTALVKQVTSRWGAFFDSWLQWGGDGAAAAKDEAVQEAGSTDGTADGDDPDETSGPSLDPDGVKAR